MQGPIAGAQAAIGRRAIAGQLDLGAQRHGRCKVPMQPPRE